MTEAEPRAGLDANRPGSHEGLLPSVHTRYGSLALMGLFQTLFSSGMVNDDNSTTETVGFTFQRARLILKGHLLTENLEYFFQGDAANMASFALDMYVKYKYRRFSIRFGRFLPDFTYMMPRSKGDLAAVDHPIYLTFGAFGVWRQIGAEMGYQINDELELKFGVFNGLMYEPNAINPQLINMQMGVIAVGGATFTNYTDNNKAKDFMLRASYQVNRNLSLDLNFWLGMPVNSTGDEDNDIVIIGGPGAEFNNGKLHLVSEFMFRVVSYGHDIDAVTSLALWAHAGYRFTDLIEGVFRVDWVEPNLDADDDMRLRLTAGAHLWIEEKHFRILSNVFIELPLPDGNEIFGILIQAALTW